MKTSLRQAAAPQRRSRPHVNDRPKRPSSGHHPRRQFLRLASGAAVLPAVSRIARAQSYPTRPITMIVPYAAGAIVDTVSRMLAERMGGALGQPIIIENISGADGSIATARAARGRPDGYMIIHGGLGTHVLNSVFYSLPYDALNDFTPVSPLLAAPVILYARKMTPAADLNELMSWLKAHPNQASLGIAGATSLRLLAASFQKETGTHFTIVPYRGGAPAVQDLMAGQIDFSFLTPDQLPLARAGVIKAYAVTSKTRLALAPDIPTFAEMGLPSVSWSSWTGFFAPKGTPRDIIDKLNVAVAEALADPAVRISIGNLGVEIFPREQQTPEALGALQKAEIEKWWPIIKEFGIKSE
jgi:tripartite-type tricarboxylate transporter receptor subunit TctC